MLLQATAEGLQNVSLVLVALAAGDLTRRTKTNLDGAFGELVSHADSAVSQLGSLVSEIRRSSEAITSASREIAAGNSRGGGAQGQASLEQELAETIRSNRGGPHAGPTILRITLPTPRRAARTS